MKGTKKIWSLVLALLLVFTLVACNTTTTEKTDSTTKTETETNTPAEGGETTDKPHAGKTIKVAGLDGGYGVKGWDRVISEFETLTGAKVEKLFAKNIQDEVRPLIQAGDAPDVMYISVGGESGLTETMLKEKAVLEVTDVLSRKVPGEEKTVSEKIVPGFTDTFTTNPYGDGKTYLLPVFYSPTGFFYNESLFKTGGGSLELPKTLDEFVALKGKVEGAHSFTYPTAGYFDTVFFTLINNVGGSELFNKLMSYDSQAWEKDAKPVFEAVGKLVSDIHPNTVSQANKEGFTQNQLSVMKNESLFMPNGTWIVGEMAEAKGVAEGFKWGFTAVPAVKDGGERYAYSFVEQVWASATTKEPEVVKDFLAYLYSDAAVKAFIEEAGAVQPVVGAVDKISDEGQKLFFSIYDGNVKAALGGFQVVDTVEGVDLKATLFDGINSVASGEKTVDQWHAEVVEAVKKIEAANK